MKLVLSKHNNNIMFIIWWFILSKLDIHTSSIIHPHVLAQYNIEDITIVLWSQQIVNVFIDFTTWKL